MIFSRVSANAFLGLFFFARKREKIFLGVFFVFFGVFVLFGGVFFCFSRVARFFFLGGVARMYYSPPRTSDERP